MIGNVMVDARSTGKYYHCTYHLFEIVTNSIIFFFQYCKIAIDYKSMSCNQLFQYPLILSHPSVAKCIGSCMLITTKSCLCSCTAYGACCFTHYARVCSTNSSKYIYHWRRGTFINLLCCFEETCVACLVAHYFFKKREKKQ